MTERIIGVGSGSGEMSTSADARPRLRGIPPPLGDTFESPRAGQVYDATTDKDVFDQTAQEIASPSGAELAMTKKPPIVPATVRFVDIAGLVKGAAEGAGLGNKFLSHIREVSVIAHVVRAFEDSSVVREGSIDVTNDYEAIRTELMLADLETIRNAKSRKKDAESRVKNQSEILERLEAALNKGIAVRDVGLSDEEKEFADTLFFLSAKPEIVVLNVSEEEYRHDRLEPIVGKYTSMLGVERGEVVVICAKIEADLAALSEKEQRQYLQELGLHESGLERLIKKAYEMLGLISFLTAGEKEVRAWTIRRGSTALMAAGEIHTDFMKKFIKAEVISYEDYISSGGRKKVRELGKARLEGRGYIIQDGDVIEFKIGA